MGEDQLVEEALARLLPFFTTEETGCYVGMKGAFRRYAGHPTPKTAAEVNELDILHYCNARFKLGDVDKVTSKELQRLLVILRITYLLENADPRNKSQCIYTPIKQTIVESKQVEETQSAMTKFIADSLTSPAITLEKLEECYQKIERALGRNKTVTQTRKALDFVVNGIVARPATGTVISVMEATTKAMTTVPYERERKELYAQRNIRDITRQLEGLELQKCEIYEAIFRDQLPILEKANKTQYHLFNKVLRELLLKYEHPISVQDRKQLNQRLKFAAAKLATAFERVKVEHDVSGFGEKKLKGGHYSAVAAKIRREIFPSKNYNSDPIDVVEALKKPSKLMSAIDKVRRNEIIKGYLATIKHLAKKAADLLGFEFADIPTAAIAPGVDLNHVVEAIEIVSGEYEANPDALDHRDRYLRRIRNFRQSIADLVMVNEAGQGINPREDIKQLLEPQGESLFFMHQTRKFTDKVDPDHPKSYLNLALIAQERAAAFEKVKDDVAQLIGVVHTEYNILEKENGDAKRRANLLVTLHRLADLQATLPADAKHGTAEVLILAQKDWDAIHDMYNNLAPAEQSIGASTKPSALPATAAAKASTPPPATAATTKHKILARYSST